MDKIEGKLKKIFFTISYYEEYISAVLGFLLVSMVIILILNFFRQNSGREKITNQAAFTENKVEMEEEIREYLVLPGDNLSLISQKLYGNENYWQEILRENDIINPNLINEGDRLKIPEIKNRNEDNLEDKEEFFNYNEKYVVSPGDSLFEIAKKVYGSESQWIVIYNANNISNPDTLYVGQELIIPR